MFFQSNRLGRMFFGAKFIIANRTANVWNASSNASVNDGARCSRFNR